ncbi:hypothetical protein BN946_scf185008.g25 [Trametes cinnabarina]|uniref:Uncharacterized protein n=1 Tax=Pycnoporus cinnabarinus TaxID=5643 RepID=A0A060SLF0_PYCCI|nr:hypothetical protein BN946_scf185008.g25 [Trametes cinnabarina]
MDDELFQNAWSETTNKIPTIPKEDTKPAWSPPKLIGEEADLAAPSWSTGAEIDWNEPTGSPGFSWSHAEPDLAWGSSVYESIPIGKTPVEEVPAATAAAEDAYEVQEPADEHPVLPAEEAHTPGAVSSLPPSSTLPEAYEVKPELVVPPSPDGFGSFETGVADTNAVSPKFSLEDDPWAAPSWAETEACSPESPDEPVDEWERARREKLKMDKRVPPELLANILRQCEELGCEICPDIPESSAEADAWRSDWRSGIDGVPGVTSLMETILPNPTLQPPVRFAQSLIAKRMAGSIKLTKNLPLAKRSPMSHYLAAKGSTAWETSVKEQKEIMEDDIPVGWRVVEKSGPAPSADSIKENKSTSRMFSFWGRRQSQISPVSTTATGETHSRSSSLEKPQSPVITEAKAESRRASQDSGHVSVTGSQTQLPQTIAESSTTSQPPAAFAATIANATPTISSYGSSTASPVPERSGTPPAPSAVSRFLNKFSRRGSTKSGSPRSSLALSSDDLEFLSDIVPSASDDAEDDSADALAKFVNATATREPTASMVPPPLAPPPTAPASRPTSTASAVASHMTPSNPFGDDLGALFGSFGSANVGASFVSTSAAGGQTSAPTLPPPLAPSRSITPSATPGAGPSRPSVAVASTFSSSQPPSRLQTSTPPISGFALPPPPSFRHIAPSKPTMVAPKPQLSFSLPRLPPSQTIERAPSSASSSSSRTSYETAVETSPTSPSSTSPTSSLPLASLYPHVAATPITPPMTSSQPMLPANTSSKRSSSPSGLITPLATSFSTVPPPLPPPPLSFTGPSVQTRPAASPSCIPLTSSLWNDDDFSDFQSPVEAASNLSPPIPPPIAKSPPKDVAPVPASRSHTAAPNLAPFSFPLPPPPANNARASTAVHSTSAFDDDDFADFQDSPSSATALKADSAISSSSSLFPSSVSDQMLLTPKKRSGFDDTSGFLESTLPTPSPPRVPAKPNPVKPLAPPPPSSSTSMPSVSSSSSLLFRRKSHAAEHLHTLNLMEKAAARPGRWPAPPSPLPEAIPGPPAGASTTSSQFDLLDDSAPLAASSSLAPSLSLPAMLSPARPASRLGGVANGPPKPSDLAASASSNSTLSSSLFQGWDFHSTSLIQRTATPPTQGAFGMQGKPTNGTQSGGLSAQDLSFFESL